MNWELLLIFQKLRLAKPTRIRIPNELWTIMCSCWSEDPENRPAFDTLYIQLDKVYKKVVGERQHRRLQKSYGEDSVVYTILKSKRNVRESVPYLEVS